MSFKLKDIFPSTNQNLKQEIKEMHMTSSFEFLSTLVRFGPRPIGSPTDRAGADNIRQVFKKAGVAVAEQPYGFTVRDRAGTRLEQGGIALTTGDNTATKKLAFPRYRFLFLILDDLVNRLCMLV